MLKLFMRDVRASKVYTKIVPNCRLDHALQDELLLYEKICMQDNGEDDKRAKETAADE